MLTGQHHAVFLVYKVLMLMPPMDALKRHMSTCLTFACQLFLPSVVWQAACPLACIDNVAESALALKD